MVIEQRGALKIRGFIKTEMNWSNVLLNQMWKSQCKVFKSFHSILLMAIMKICLRGYMQLSEESLKIKDSI